MTLVERLLAGEIETEVLEALLTTPDEAVEAALYAAADRVRQEHMGEGVHLRALIEFSSHCTRTCRYCGLRAPNRGLPRYRMTPEAIAAAARHAASLGYQTVVLQSGEDAWFGRTVVGDLVRRIKGETGMAITLCLGERRREDYAAWREAGADRYLLRIETSDPDLYAGLHPGMSFARRVCCVHDLRELDYQVGSGLLVGLPGQTTALLARDLLFLRDLAPDMVGLGPFIPHPQTPLAEAPRCEVGLVLRMMALTRLLLPQCHLVATTALGSIDPLGREKGLQAGANAMMPNATPQVYRAAYEIYPDKICLDEQPEHCRGCLEARLRSLGRHVAAGPGHALRVGG